MKQMLLSVVMLAVVHHSCAVAGEKKEKSPALPGAKGPLFTKVGKLKGGVEVLSADVKNSEQIKGTSLDNPPKSRTLPSRTKVVVVYVKFSGKFDFKEGSIEIQGPDGRVELDKVAYADAMVFDEGTGTAVATYMCGPKTKVFADGAYQAKIKSGTQVFLLVNWQIGDPPKMNGDDEAK